MYVVAAASAGIAGGFLAHYLEGKGWFINQARYNAKSASSCCSTEESSTCCSEESKAKENSIVGYLVELWGVGRRLLLTFSLASFLGYFMGNLIPPTWINLLFGSGKGWSIPLAALSGIPFYLNISSSLPIARAFIAHGATPGAAMAFLLVGAGTSSGAVAGLLTIARWRVIALVTVVLLIVAIIFGYAFDVLLAVKILC